MENAQLIALSRQSALRNQLDVVANNMANINTTGFKSQRMLFEEYHYARRRGDGVSTPGPRSFLRS
jgi:flagellar basal body rod protein FlgG